MAVIRFSFLKAALRDPWASEVTSLRIEDALECDGTACTGQELEPWPHWHLVATGKDPEAGPRFHPIDF